MNQNLNLKQQLRCIYISDFFSGLRITDAVWVALLAARGFSLWEIGLAESVYHIVSLFCEVPSGMAADLLGRRKTLLSGGVLTVTCNLLMAFAPNLFTICLAMGLNALAMTMFSGTFTALVYDSLKTEGREDEYIQVSANSSQISMLANAIGSLASLLKRFLGFAGFYLLSAAFEGVSTAALALMEEPIVTKAQANREKHPLRTLPEQFRQLVRDSLHVLHTCPMAGRLIASSALISVPSYLTKMFLQQRLVELGWPTELLFLPLLLGGLACVVGTEIGRRVRCRSMRRLYTACALLCGVGTLLVGAAPAWGGILGMMLVQGVLEVYLLHESQKLNDAIPSDQRATLISVDGMAYSLLMIPASPLVGAVGDAFGQAGAGLALLGGVIVLSGVALLGKKPQES
ncbi:MFS transporter [Faecalibacterium prausnitzii]|uniref:MFS transporter n=1 Tax=Faecalibacterium prausnitzii TaxID=853 RepID=A0A3E2TCM2_9FIRM|nr:MFS transporter [Faecalibacterium prausnitzii]RGB72671.1 MFS transporter [Faecalibacterium prausnitzii]